MDPLVPPDALVSAPGPANPPGDGRGAPVHSSYTAILQGSINLTCRGSARFGPVTGGAASPHVLTLGLEDEPHTFIFTWIRAGRPVPREYTLCDVPETDGAEHAVRAVVIAGPASRPAGIFRAEAGALSVTSSSAEFLTGTFELRGSGWLTRYPGEQRELVALGSFVAAARGAPDPSHAGPDR